MQREGVENEKTTKDLLSGTKNPSKIQESSYLGQQ
jgi:hypothetical protein